MFLDARPRDLHTPPPPWHRLALVVRTLPPAIERLIPALGVGPGDRVLDYGCADMPYARSFVPGVGVVGADLPGNPMASANIAPDGTVAVADASMHAVLSTQVLEHVADPERYLAECHRVLRPGGRMLLTTHGTMFYHPDPVDYWRWTCAGLERAITQAGFEIEHREGVVGMAATGVQLVQETFHYRLPRWLQTPFVLVLQSLARLLDRLEADASRDMNAMVFAVVAIKR